MQENKKEKAKEKLCRFFVCAVCKGLSTYNGKNCIAGMRRHGSLDLGG